VDTVVDSVGRIVIPGTRSPKPIQCARVCPVTCAWRRPTRLLRERFAPPLLLKSSTARRLTATLSGLDIAGGAAYDAIIALAAVDNDSGRATRDARAKATYDLVGARFEVAG
jgi:toxin FitB